MPSGCSDGLTADEHVEEGLLILARIISRDFMAKQALNGNCENGGSNNEDIQNE